MCIIVAKEKGKKLPNKSILETCFIKNNDGAGLMYVKNNQVIIDKGYMTFDSLYKRIEELKKEFNSDLTDKSLVIHFRIGTHGENDKYTTHPFPITNNRDELRKTKTTCSVGMAHNGIISEYNYDKVLSDTQSFIKDCVSVYKSYNKQFYKDKRIMSILEKSINGSRLCFLDNKENIYYIGNFIEDEGIKYSNSTYKQVQYNNYYSGYYNGNSGKYYDDSDYFYDEYYKRKYASQFNKTENKTELDIDTTELEDLGLMDFIEKHPNYETLEVGDYYLLDGYLCEVLEDDYLMIDDKNNLWEYLGNCVSLIGTNVNIYDKNFNQKEVA